MSYNYDKFINARVFNYTAPSSQLIGADAGVATRAAGIGRSGVLVTCTGADATIKITGGGATGTVPSYTITADDTGTYIPFADNVALSLTCTGTVTCVEYAS